MSLERLQTAARYLDEAQLDLLCEMADAFGWQVEVYKNPKSDLIRDGFGDSLLNRLRLHHATSEEKFNKTSFEFAFKTASRFAGRRAEKTLEHTFQGADVVVEDVRWSLKTEGAARMSQSNITISKFSEARWIRDCVTPEDFAREATARMSKHLSEYDRVLTLRSSYVQNKEAVRYDLVEIPHDMLMAATKLTAADFSPLTKKGSTSAWVMFEGKQAFTVILDGSVEKITLRNISVGQCVTHARWIVPVLPQDD
ncbi:hypothetical protein [Nocardiopsis alkaliphila]|uniref:hypothetical protein n=1 Tax=Nocardiopsis alkaliphila TaxID=225762 RepID=UPI00037ECC64|nr:hypothetical protein [Nocardiopsis alkaliphila]